MTDNGECTDSRSKNRKGAGWSKGSQNRHPKGSGDALLGSYIRDAGRYPLLSKVEQEVAFWKYIELGDLDAKELIVVSNLRLVIKIASRYHSHIRSPIIDLIQEGNLGLMKAVDKFDPGRGVRFSYYASFWIRSYILRHIMMNKGAVRSQVNEKRKALLRKINKERQRLISMDIEEPTTKEIAAGLDIEEKDVLEAEIAMKYGDVSLDRPVSKNDDTALVETVQSDYNTEDLVFEKDLKEKGWEIFRRFRNTLSEKEQLIFDKRFLSEDRITLETIGNQLNLSRERIRQLENIIQDKLNRFARIKKNYNMEEEDRASDLKNVSLAEIEAVTRKGKKVREIVKLYFGLKEGRKRVGIKEISTETITRPCLVRQYINDVQFKIRRMRKEREDDTETDPDSSDELFDDLCESDQRDSDTGQMSSGCVGSEKCKSLKKVRLSVDLSFKIGVIP